VSEPSREIWSPAHEKNVTDRHANDRGHPGEHRRGGGVRQQQLFLVDDEHDADDEQHPRDDDSDNAHDDEAQIQTGLLSRRFIGPLGCLLVFIPTLQSSGATRRS
jgi:hypothetical protein